MVAVMASAFKKATQTTKSENENLIIWKLNDILIVCRISSHLSVECQQGSHDWYTTAGVSARIGLTGLSPKSNTQSASQAKCFVRLAPWLVGLTLFI
jgi:hypothetical protein